MNFDQESQVENEELFQVTSMVDVVFILLAFFVLTVQFIQPESEMAIGHGRQAEMSGAVAGDFPPQIVVRVSLADDQNLIISVGDRIITNGQLEQLTSALSKINVPTIPVILAAHPALSVQQVTSALDAILASPMKQVTLVQLTVGR